METPKKIPYISGNKNPEKLLIFWEIELLRPSSKNKKIPSKRFFIFSYISGN